MRHERKPLENLTFRNGDAVHLNACVGNNSGIDNRNGYAWGFAVSVKIMLSAALNGSYVDVLEGERDPQIDGLIYPIAFCARHHIELFLKREISYVSDIRGPSRTPPNKHDLGILWKDFLDTCASTDRFLLSSAEPLAEYVLDFTQIDPTGQTFRYASGKKNITHLTQISVINLYNFAERFYEMIELIEKFEVAREVVEWEYAQGTYTRKLSRGELSDLANALPNRSEWAGSEKFLEVRNEFRQRYELSSNDFAKAINIIESHREFSARLGVELAIGELQCDVFSRLVSIRAGTADTAILSDSEWAALFAICEVGRAQTYSESYDVELKDAIDAIENGRMDRAHTLRTVVGANGRFFKGLKRMGQITLAAHFKDHFKDL
jgi:hypothetical protein